MTLPTNKTKIVCTLGPASESPQVMEQIIGAGMNVARLNFSHGNFPSHRKAIVNLRKAAALTNRNVAVLADLPGPKIRIGALAREPVELKPGFSFTLTTVEGEGDERHATIGFEAFPEVVKPGDMLFLNDGYIQLEVVSAGNKEVKTEVVVGGELRSRKGVNLPGVDLGIGAFTERDRACLKFALGNGADAVSQSFVQHASDVQAVKDASGALGYRPFVIAKIERADALKHIDEILEAADGIMIARGDLGGEMPIEEMAIVQKDLARKANILGKPVIVATQMLESMIDHRRPTRAEATDVANAILDGADCVMLSGESATGRYPVQATAMLAKIATAVEKRGRPACFAGESAIPTRKDAPLGIRDLIALSVETTCRHVSPAAVIVPTLSGATARSIARFRLPQWITAVSPLEDTCRGLQFSYGVHPVHAPDHPKDWKAFARRWLVENGLKGDLAVLTEGPSTEHPETNHRMEIVDLRRD